MTLILIFVAGILLVAAYRNTQGALGAALAQDVPGYLVWAAALFAVGALGYIPGLKTPSRALLALVILVIILKNYQGILTGFSQVSQGAPAAAPATTPGQVAAASAASQGVQWAGPDAPSGTTGQYAALTQYATTAATAAAGAAIAA